VKIIIIGADGQLGLDCTSILAGEHNLILPTIAELDLCEESSLRGFISAHRPEVVINCAAYTAVDHCEKELEICRRVNADGPGFLAKACGETGSRLIHISTDYVFDGRKPIPHPYLEEDPVHPLSHYGRTKLDGERAVAAYGDDYAILRTAWLYSAGGPNFLKTMLRISLADPAATRRVVDDQYGSPTWSHTLARQISLLLTSEIQGVVHTTSEGYATWYETACSFLEKMEIEHNLAPCKTADYPTPAHRPANSILDNGVLNQHGLSLFVDWRDDLDTFVKRHGRQLLAELGSV